MKLEVLPAAKGDCLLLHHGAADAPKLILIDGGPSGTYSARLLPRLKGLRAERIAAGLITDEDPLFIDLLIISHIDDDHINGIEALLREMLQREQAGQPPLFVIGRMWHNSFNHLVDAPTSITITASLAAGGADAHPHDDADLILASVEQGFDVLNLAGTLGIKVNPEFGNDLIIADETPRDVDGLKMTVIGPMLPELKKLQKDFKDWMLAHPDKAVTASVLASFDDTSVPNLSSIVLLVKDEADGQSALLTGDARGDKMMKSVKALGLLDADNRLPVDILKAPHHGSDRNTSADFFAMFPAPLLVMSGNGEHGNPERQTLAYLTEGRGGRAVTVQLTYAPGVIDVGRQKDWETKKLPRHPEIGPWKPAEHGIVAYFDATPSITVKHP